MAPSRWSALWHRLGLAPGRSPATPSDPGPGPPASRDAANAWDGPSPRGRAPASEPPSSPSPPPNLLRSLARRDGIRVQSLGPSSVLTELSFEGVTIPYFQYGHCNLLLIHGSRESDGLRCHLAYRARPRPLFPAPLVPGTTTRLHRLVCDPGLLSLSDHEALIEAASSPPDRPAGEGIDLGPALHRDLLRALPRLSTPDAGRLVALIDLLATFEGHGSDELAPRRALLGADALHRLDALAASDPAVDTRAARAALRRSDDRRRITLIEVDRTIDGHVGGHHRELALGTLGVGPRGWSYERRLLHVDDEEGTPMS